MLKHFSCISVDDHVKADVAEAAKAAAAEVAVDKDRVSSSTAKASTAGNEATASSSFLASATAGHLVTLPPATPTVGVTFRLFASNGKLLAHIEDDLELYPTGSGAHRSVTRDPVAFHIPTEDSAEKGRKPAEAECQPHHRNNSHFDMRRQKRSCASVATISSNTPMAVSAASPASITSLTLRTLCTPTGGEHAQCDRYFQYYGSIRALRSQLPTSNGKQQRLETAQRMLSRLSPLLIEPDGRSGCTAAVGCVPSVPVARSRLTTHRGAALGDAGMAAAAGGSQRGDIVRS